MGYTVTEIQDAIENTWSDFQNKISEKNLDGRTELIVERLVSEVLDNVENELGQ